MHNFHTVAKLNNHNMADILLNMHNTVYTQAQTNHKEANILLRMRSLNPDANKP